MSTSNMCDLVKEKCTEHFDPSYITVVDHSDGCGAKLELTIVSSKFDKKPLLARHRMVHSLMKESGYMDTIHALTINAWTEEQFKKKQSQS